MHCCVPGRVGRVGLGAWREQAGLADGGAWEGHYNNLDYCWNQKIGLWLLTVKKLLLAFFETGSLDSDWPNTYLLTQFFLSKYLYFI